MDITKHLFTSIPEEPVAGTVNMKLQDLVHNWLLGGADPEVGLRLFMDYTNPSLPIARMISRSPEKYLQTIKVALLQQVGLPLDTSIVSASKRTYNESRTNDKRKIRSDWPFLADPECPPELKLLISDKITAYRNCMEEYENLTKSISASEQLNTVRSLVTNFIANHDIYKELKHYKDKGKIMGEHKIFEQYKRVRDLRNLNSMDLFKKKKNLEYSIWRNESKIKKENRADLLHNRLEKIKELKMELAEVDRLLV